MARMSRRGLLLAAGFVLAVAPLGASLAQQFSNATTRLNLGRCTGTQRPDGAGPAWRCKGFENAPDHDVTVFEEGSHYYISFGRDPFALRAAEQTLVPANTIADSLEWRLERGAAGWEPFAAIARYYTEVDDDGSPYRGEVIVVSKLGPGEACHAVYIDARANPSANRLAREAADTIARTFDCATGEPIVYGERGLSLGPTS